jgi:hypothetical protein
MLIKIEEADTDTGWFVVLDICRVRFSTYIEAEAFFIRLTDRINAPHSLPEHIYMADEALS